VTLPTSPPPASKSRAATLVTALVCLSAVTFLPGAPAQTEEVEAPKAAAPTGAPNVAPVWVPNVVRIDRGSETRERVVEEIDDRFTLMPTSPLTIHRDGSFAAMGGRFRIAGLRLPERSLLCETRDLRRWPCGVRAHAKFSAMLAGQRLACRPHGTPDEQQRLYDCATPDRRSIAGTMIAEGWAEADTATGDAKLAGLQAKAQSAGLGIWGKDMPGSGPSPVSSEFRR
jgi:endonuclease YncB( thermonuclease family)